MIPCQSPKVLTLNTIVSLAQGATVLGEGDAPPGFPGYVIGSL